MLQGLLRRWRAPAVSSAADLSEFLDKNASLIAQKSVIGYCHVKTNLPLSELLKEKQFVEAFEVARWEAFAAVLADLVMVAEAHLRPAAAGRLVAVADRLVDLYREILARHPVPAHRAEGWQAEIGAMRTRLTAAQETLPLSIMKISETSARRVYDTLPIHERLREPDQPAVEANVRFLMVGLAHKFEANFDTAAIVDDLLAARR
jgi:hypothetical protein